jgi:hypothetical protein
MSIAFFLLTLLFPTPASELENPVTAVAPLPPLPVALNWPTATAWSEPLPQKLPKYTVVATVYHAVEGQTDDEPFVTADNSRIKPNYSSKTRWVALSRDLLKPWGGPFRFGQRVRISGISNKLDGVYTIHDTMNRRHKHCVDVLAHPREKLDGLWRGITLRPLPEAPPAPLLAYAAFQQPHSQAPL